MQTYEKTFTQHGRNQHAIELLKKRWILHQKKTGATYTFSEMLEDVFFCKIQAGAYEDNELPTPPLEEECSHDWAVEKEVSFCLLCSIGEDEAREENCDTENSLENEGK
jgi:hypothetical protein